MQIDVKPLVWVQLSTAKVSGAYRIKMDTYGQGQPFWSWGSTIMGRGDTDDELTAAANAHHAAHVRSQVAGVRMSDEEAYALSGAAINSWSAGNNASHALASVQAAIAAMQVGE